MAVSAYLQAVFSSNLQERKVLIKKGAHTSIVNRTVNPCKSVEDNGNRFLGHAVSVESFKQVRKFIVEVMRINTISSASHNIYPY